MRSAFKFVLLLTLQTCLLPVAHAAPARLVTLAPVIAEWTTEILGKDETLKRLVGVSEYSNFPSYLSSIHTVGAYPQLNIEAIAALKPDLVIGSSEYNLPEQIEKLKRLHLNVVLLPKEDFHVMPGWIEKLGKLIGDEKGGKRAALDWEKAVNSLEVPKLEHSLVIEVQHEPLIVVGGESFLNEAFSLVGYRNVFSNLHQGYPKISKEAVLRENPDRIFIMDLTDDSKAFKKAEADWAKYKDLNAVRKNGIRIISGSDFARCSPQLLKALKQLR